MKLPGKILSAVFCVMATSFGAAEAAGTDAAPNINTVLATVDGTDITLGNVIALRTRLPKQYKQQPDDVLMKGIVDELVQQTVLMNAIKTKLSNREALIFENQKRAFLAAATIKRILGRKVSQEALKAAYDAKYAAAAPQREYNASHILVKTKAEAVDIIKQLKNGTDFAALAKQKSTGPSGSNGGKLGWFAKGQMLKAFEDGVVKLSVGQISEPVETKYGWHVIKLNDSRNKAIPTLDQERARLTKELQQKAVEDEIARLMKSANVTRPKVDIDPAVIRDVSLLDK